MASAVVSKGSPLAGLEKLLTEPFMSVAAARRSRKRNKNASSDSEDDVAVDNRRRKRDISGPVFFTSAGLIGVRSSVILGIFADLLDQFGAPKTLGQLLSKLEDAVKAEHVSMAAPRGGCWVAKQDDDAMTLKVAMPGLGKEHVKIRADQNVLVIKGEGHKETEDDKGDKETADDKGNKETADDKGEGHKETEVDTEEVLRYSHRIELPADAFKMDQVRAEMKNGLLTVTVPKVKDEERKDVFHITVE
ncbi:hypothetical protein PR202_ga17723 [Eleusine coracana subsp. coracana]|uniref:SHSP domain-containing protein n=1 Tax=Eleusine coracana subsp. coracana TaxID=191504 RepID=A0AAV5CQ43_ELECO|nr:hypothetical protein PR202_ga17476 [Eleusine coracana subsp. coracana]GJN00534.1 hypothetical protein PR202_ga17723 [Eleusine coracana subsp. coracana]